MTSDYDVTLEPAEDEGECERLGLQRIYTVRRHGQTVWAGEAASAEDAVDKAERQREREVVSDSYTRHGPWARMSRDGR